MDKTFRKRKLSAVKVRVEDSVTVEEEVPAEGLRRSKRRLKVIQTSEIVVPAPKPSRPKKTAAKATAVLTELGNEGEQSAVLPAAPLQVWSDDSLKAAAAHLAAADAKLAPLIEACGKPDRLRAKGCVNMFASLAHSIVYQQLAGSAAAAIHARFLAACGGADPVQPAAVLKVPMADLRACGLSERKASYILDLATHFDSGLLSDSSISAMTDDVLVEQLTKVKGIGRWSVDMFGMFHLARPDILPVGDLGVRKGMQQLYGLKELPKPAEMEAIAHTWRPYRSLGSFYMWHVTDAAGSPSKRQKKAKKTPIGKGKPVTSVPGIA